MLVCYEQLVLSQWDSADNQSGFRRSFKLKVSNSENLLTMMAAAATLVVPKLNISSRFLGDKLPVEERNFWKSSARRGLIVRRTKCAVDMPYGGGGGVAKFNRMFVWDPYKRLGISKDASDDEIWGARNFLLDQYSQDESSYESIEGAFEKLLMTSFRERKRTKMNLKSRLKKKVEESPPWIKSILGFVEIPPGVIVLRRLFLFGFMACWSVMNSAETGPAFQVAISLGACVYFLNDKMKNLGRAAITGFLALVVGWMLGSIMVPSIPRFLLQPTWTLELLTSLVVYASFFLACTFLK